MPLYLFTRVFHFIEIGKKIRGHDFEEVMHACDNWKNPMRDVTDLIGQLEAATGVKYSPRWYNILEKIGDTHWTTSCIHVKACVSYLFNHWFYFIVIGKKYVRVDMILKRSCMRMIIGGIRCKMSLI